MSDFETTVSKKARRIAQILQRYVVLDGAALLDIGTGSGGTAAGLQALGATVTAIDRQDTNLTAAGLDFHLVDGTGLPFDDNAFGAVLYSHVIEHVGSRDDQRHHLSEIRRVLQRDGVLYLAMPNRWSVLEPHYNLPFLSWLPTGIASVYLRMTRQAPAYDCCPLSRRN
ncbi:MAG: class I SAM-dependent methyltransferase, partial [Rhodospirillaceae bacterium]|nr:class I SAM-dependent methyltransferase [Rhodospirillaceae bacterium]